MNDLEKSGFVILFALFGAVQVTCIPAPSPTSTPTPRAFPTDTRPPLPTPTRTPTWTPTLPSTFTPTPLTPTATPFPSATPTPSPRPSSTPAVPLAFRTIHMMDTKIGWALADVGSEDATRVLRTKDGGKTWAMSARCRSTS
jgi:hypothetical protein